MLALSGPVTGRFPAENCDPLPTPPTASRIARLSDPFPTLFRERARGWVLLGFVGAHLVLCVGTDLVLAPWVSNTGSLFLTWEKWVLSPGWPLSVAEEGGQ